MIEPKKTLKATKNGDEGVSSTVSNVRANDTFTGECKQALAEVFAAVLDLPVWVVSGSNKAPRDAEGEPFSEWSSPATVLSTYAEARATADQYGLPHVGLVFPADGIVVDGWRLLCIDVDEVEGYRKYQPDKPGKPGCTAITFDPATDAATVLARVPLVSQLPQTVWEASSSNTSFHGFMWVPADQDYWGRRHAKLAGCDHVDTFIAGRRAAHLITTGVLLTRCTTIARVDDIELLKPILQPAGDPNGPAELIITDEGEPFDLPALALTDDQARFVRGIYEGDRSPVMRSLLIRLIDAGKSPGNILASLCANDATRGYLLDHRNQDPTRAIDFARFEISGAYKLSITGRMASNLGFMPAWKDGELLAEPAEVKPISRLCEPISAFMAGREKQEVIVDGILYKGDHNACLGHPNGGKTTGALELCLHVAMGWALEGHEVKRNISVYLAGEDPAGVRRRVKRWCLDHDVDEKDLEGWLYVVRRPVLGDTEQAAALLAELRIIKPGLLVVDTFAPNYGGKSEDDAVEMKKWMAMIRQDFVIGLNCCVLTLHHPPKGSKNIYNFRGSSVAAGDFDNIFGFFMIGDTVQMALGGAEGKCRTADFEPLFWRTEKAEIPDWLNNMGRPETTVRATLVDHPGGQIPKEAKVCRAIQAFVDRGVKQTNRKIAELAGVPTGSIGYLLSSMKTAKLIKEAKGTGFVLAEAGETQLPFAVLDRELTERIKKLGE